MAKIARALGQPFMPWQQHVADVAGEVDPRTGLPVYREIVLLVPRQSGKTTLLLSEMVHRAWAFGRPQLTRYAAQTGDDAIGKWKEHVEILEGTPFRTLFETEDTNGQRSLQWANKSRYTPTATTKKSGHGKTLDQGVIDEAFAQVDFRTEQAMVPAMVTRADAQLFVVSTAGDLTSVFLNAKIAANRERLEADPLAPSSVAYFEWSIPEDEDPFAEETWWRHMPALGRTIGPGAIRSALESMLADPLEGERGFRRAFGNQTDRGSANETVFAAEDWRDTGTDESWIVGPRALALDVTPDRSYAAVAWAGYNARGEMHFEVIKHERNTHWVAGFLIEKIKRQRGNVTVSLAGKQAAAMEDELTDLGIDVRILSAADYVAACASFHEGIVRRTSRHLRTGQLDLDVAIAAAAWTNSEARTWDRRKSTVTDISPLVACTVAQWAFVLEEREREDDYDVMDSVG